MIKIALTISMAMLLGTIASAADILFSNLDKSSVNLYSANKNELLATSFKVGTGAPGYQLSSATLAFGGISGSGGEVAVEIWTGSVPDSYIATLNGPSFPTTGAVSYNPISAVTLTPGEFYSIVLSYSGSSGSIVWDFTFTNESAGSGNTLGKNIDPKYDWTAFAPGQSFKFEIAAIAIPEPASYGCLFGLSVLTGALFTRRRKP